MSELFSWLVEGDQALSVLLMIGTGIVVLICGLVAFSIGHDVGFARGRRYQLRQGYQPERDWNGRRIRERR
jgi:hypothetical protein